MFNIFQNQKTKNQEPIECEQEPLVPMPKHTKTVKVRVPKRKFVEFKDGFGNVCSGVHIHTRTYTKWKKNPNIYIVVLLKTNGNAKGKKSPLTLKWINECYCVEIKEYPTLNHTSAVFDVENWDITNLTYIG